MCPKRKVWWWGYYDPGEGPKSPTYSKEEIETLKGPAKEAAQNEWKKFKKASEYHQNEKQTYNDIKQALDTNNGVEAYSVLDLRSDYEYEKMEIIYPTQLEYSDESN